MMITASENIFGNLNYIMPNFLWKVSKLSKFREKNLYVKWDILAKNNQYLCWNSSTEVEDWVVATQEYKFWNTNRNIAGSNQNEENCCDKW